MTNPSSAAAESYDVIVAGSGSAGMFAALEAQRAGRVLLVTKDQLGASNTWYAQGGMAAAMAPGDSIEAHLQDTIAAGAGIVDETAARVLCEAAPASIATLQEMGVQFDLAGSNVALGREAAHSFERIIHSGGDQTGRGLVTGLTDALSHSAVEVREGEFVTRILLEEGHVAGVEVLTEDGARRHYRAESVVLATGGAGQVFSHTTNPAVATGDGIALAYHAGAELADLEFFQFHPTAFHGEGADPFLISEAIRGEGAVLRNATGEAFMKRYDPSRELAPRDVVARAMVREMRLNMVDHVLLDCTGITHVNVAERFPGIARYCSKLGIDISREPIPVAPAAHYFMGGVRTDSDGRTTVPGLYACGEVACTGVHGANRLASNSLVETIVFAQRVADHIVSGTGGAAALATDAITLAAAGRAPKETAVLQDLMWEACGIERDGATMREARSHMDAWPSTREASRPSEEAKQNLSVVARLMLEAALRREESRGAHFRSDFPERDDQQWKRRQVIRRED